MPDLFVQTVAMLLRVIIILGFFLAGAAPAPAAEESFGQALKKIFATPTPTPRPHKKKATPAKKKSPTLTPTPKKSATSNESESPTPTPTPTKKRTPATEEESLSPTPKKKKTPVGEAESPSLTSKKKSPTPTPSLGPHRKKRVPPSPEPFETPESATPSPSPSAPPTESPTPTPLKKHGAPNATVSPDQIKGFDNYPPKVQRLLAGALELTTRNLDYKYGSADPENGGMDCSGFVYFVLKKNGIDGVPRDSTEQYNWLRRAHAFEAVLSQKDDSYELDGLRPGDLLFWTGTYSVERDPPITHTMIYVGREKKSGKRIMVGSSDGRVYHGESRFGVSVFDFKIPRPENNGNGKLQPMFVGYGHIQELQQ